MSSHNWREADYTDIQLSRLLKNWAGRRMQVSVPGRAALLSRAYHQAEGLRVPAMPLAGRFRPLSRGVEHPAWSTEVSLASSLLLVFQSAQLRLSL
ncbi:MAG: hypothetical protein OHK0052_03760 [Anaerolineales bacterium]